MPEDYIYAVTRIHIRERNLLNGADIDALSSAKSFSEALSLLAAKGWETQLVSGGDTEALINTEYEKTWALIAEAAGQVEELNIFRRTRDFHNLKAAIKLTYTGEPSHSRARYFLDYGLTPTERIIQAADNREFSLLPDYLAKAGKEAWEALVNTGNGQLCEIVIDRAALEDLDREGKASGNPLIRRYATFTVDTANIKAAARCHLLSRGCKFLEHVVAEGGSLNRKGLIDAALGDGYEIGKFLSGTPYEGAASTESSGAFERWRNDELIRMIRPQAKAYSGVEPLAAYILARENEIAMARLILSSKAVGLSESAVKERLGLTYV
ncbi:MAG: V-type ATPase subunit [Clostridiales bacterium]|jgi:V/A-type H+-transporting ATPase subunit C|nr:V-type ATPase subunit [Clostridiales bacterium]